MSESLIEKEIIKTDFLNFRSGHQYESENLACLNKEGKCNAKKCGYFSYAKNSNLSNVLQYAFTKNLFSKKNNQKYYFISTYYIIYII